MNKESSIAILANLLRRHEDAAEKYDDAAAMVDNPGLKEYLSSLAKYRHSLYQSIRQWLEDMPPSPVPVSGKVRSYLHNNWAEMQEALMREQESKIVEACKKSEEDISDYYKEALAQKGIPVQIHKGLQQQHSRIMEVLRKVERMEKVPTGRNNSF
ncbi:MAG: PA2169 family four-helix-bundle protein [Lewinellaceae bacterium]|nr:PA2169 family four-helix-bundle protein [Lewinellaceae bacterium]